MTMAFLTASVPLDRVARVQIYLNSKRKSVAQIKSETGAQYILNGTLYNMRTGAVNCHLKVDGKVIAKPNYSVCGYAWNTGSDFGMDALPASPTKNYIACTPLIVSGKKTKLIYDPGQGGARPRSAIGMKQGRIMLYCNSWNKSPETLQKDLLTAGWESAVMLDGGGSTQCDFDGRKITSSRRVQNLILIYTNDGEPKGEKPDMTQVNVYSKAKEGNQYVAKNFKVKEFTCSDGTDTVLIHKDLPVILQKIRDHFGKPVNILSGYRTESKNASVGGATYSQHKYGTAADITIKGVPPKQIAAYAETLLPNSGGIGIYSTFCHVDVRKTKARWNG